MKRIFSLLIICNSVWSCNNAETKLPETAMDAGREFIRASLDGNFETAESLLLRDTQNLQLFDSYKQFYGKLPAEQKRKYKEAAYNINKFQEVDDSTTLINYSNSYMNKPMEIKLVRLKKNWNVDFKYTYSGNLPIN